MTDSETELAPDYVRISSGVVVSDFHLQEDGEPAVVEKGGKVIDTAVVNWWDYWVCGEMSNTIVSHGEIFVSSGGVISNTTIHESSAVDVRSGGIAYNTRIMSSAFLAVHSGGTAIDVVADNGALLWITVAPNTYVKGTIDDSSFETQNGFISNNTIFSGCKLLLSNGGMAVCTTVMKDGVLKVANGGTAVSPSIENGGMLSVAKGGFASNVIAKKGAKIQMEIAPGTFISGVVDGEAFCVKNGLLSKFNIRNGDNVTVLKGGTVNDIIIESGGSLTISCGGIANNVGLDSYSAYSCRVLDGGKLNGFFRIESNEENK